MRISDWSSDVCASDLGGVWRQRAAREPRRLQRASARRRGHRGRRRELQLLQTAEWSAERRHRRAALAHRQCAGHLRGGAREDGGAGRLLPRSEEQKSELQSLMRISYDVFCLKKKKNETSNRGL